MSLTVAEKEHWKTRIEARINAKIEALYAEKPNLQEQVKREARKAALVSLGLDEWEEQAQDIEAEIKRLEQQKRDVEIQMLAIVRGVQVDRCLQNTYFLDRASEVTSAIARRQAALEDTELLKDEVGKDILRLKRERDNLLDTVWLATGTAQIKELWSSVTALLDVSETPLEAAAMKIRPDKPRK